MFIESYADSLEIKVENLKYPYEILFSMIIDSF